MTGIETEVKDFKISVKNVKTVESRNLQVGVLRFANQSRFLASRKRCCLRQRHSLSGRFTCNQRWAVNADIHYHAGVNCR
jgi:hypothetical protein